MFEFKSIAHARGSLIPLVRNYLHVWVFFRQMNERTTRCLFCHFHVISLLTLSFIGIEGE